MNTLDQIVEELKTYHKCHTIILYGSRARGLVTATSDYDVLGVNSKGQKTRIAKKQNGHYWDVFIYAEKDLKKLPSHHVMAWKNAKIIYDKKSYGKALLKRVQKYFTNSFKPLPEYEINSLKVWAQKEFDRCKINDIQGLFRRVEFLAALVDHYFVIRKRRFWGPKAGFAWLQKNDKTSFNLIQRALKNPKSLANLKSAATRVYKIKNFDQPTTKNSV